MSTKNKNCFQKGRLLTREEVVSDLKILKRKKTIWNVCLAIAVTLRVLLYLSFVGYCVYVGMQLKEQSRNTSVIWIVMFAEICVGELFPLFWFVWTYFKYLEGDFLSVDLGIFGKLMILFWTVIECCISVFNLYLSRDIDFNKPPIGLYVYLVLILLYLYPHELLVKKFGEVSKKYERREFQLDMFGVEGWWYGTDWRRA
ncbi:hypothetical protein CAEBREN_03132 [Caenorhabditis brenneri]|uniref:Uncharacterized protein n=1 Tax=Caenorhabditis brenneri TaxID=135651 RepID=G0MV31_CAEBE|nr:hypothetical protein CAEBREN_03132 [Caenorhabditis brenneri]